MRTVSLQDATADLPLLTVSAERAEDVGSRSGFFSWRVIRSKPADVLEEHEHAIFIIL
jgi:hypothetical protein